MRFEDLDVRKRPARLSADIYKYFANCKNFGFKDQITRSSLSVPSNFAESYERSSNKDTIGIEPPLRCGVACTPKVSV